MAPRPTCMGPRTPRRTCGSTPGIAAFGKTYCFGPTFRAEKSKTRRHLTEFWMVEPEMAFARLEDVMVLGERAALANEHVEVMEHQRRAPERRERKHAQGFGEALERLFVDAVVAHHEARFRVERARRREPQRIEDDHAIAKRAENRRLFVESLPRVVKTERALRQDARVERRHPNTVFFACAFGGAQPLARLHVAEAARVPLLVAVREHRVPCVARPRRPSSRAQW